jgi:hypothetical protein
VGPRGGQDSEAIGEILLSLPGIEPRSPGRPTRIQTLYCLSYPVSLVNKYKHTFYLHGNTVLNLRVVPYNFNDGAKNGSWIPVSIISDNGNHSLNDNIFLRTN